MVAENCIDNSEEALILVDAHVHIYDCYDVDALLNAALDNFTRVSEDIGTLESKITTVLLLTETNRDKWFQKTSEKCREEEYLVTARGDWVIYNTTDNLVLQAKKLIRGSETETIIFIVAGSQIVTAEGLELLALVSSSKFDDGLPVSSALNEIRAQDSVSVLPWAVGKWLGKRGDIVSRLIEEQAGTDLCLGDNSGRPAFWRNPVHFQKARDHKIKIIPGTDPLPFPGEVKRVGSFGFIANGELSDLKPSDDLKKILRGDSSNITAFGQLESNFRFFSNQIRLRLK